jgi:hypothetical protein
MFVKIILIQLLCFWTLTIILFLFKAYSVSEDGFSLRLQVEPTQLGLNNRASCYLRSQRERKKNRTMENVQKHKIWGEKKSTLSTQAQYRIGGNFVYKRLSQC